MEWEGEKIEGVDQGWKLPGRLRWGKRDNQDMNEGGGCYQQMLKKMAAHQKINFQWKFLLNHLHVDPFIVQLIEIIK